MYTYVGGSFASVLRLRPRQFRGRFMPRAKLLENTQKGPVREQCPTATQAVSKASWPFSQQNCERMHEPSATFPGRAGAGKVRCQLDSVTALNPKWHDGKQVQTSGETKRGKQLTSKLETPQRRPPPSYDAPLPRCVMTFQ